MTDYVLMPGAHYQAICDAVRERTGMKDTLRSGDLPQEILNISGGTADGFYDAFWDAYQNNGERINYYQRFVQDSWNDATFCPKYPITCQGGSTNGRSVFSNSRISQIGVPVIITGIPAQETFNRCIRLEVISQLVLNGVTDCSGMFSGCSQLRELNVEGSIDVNFNLSAAEFLSDESVEKVLACLKDLTGQTTQTLTLHDAVAGRLSDEQKAGITAKNWTLAY